MKRRYILTAAAILVAMMFAMNGCGSSDDNGSDSNVTASKTFYGAAIGKILDGLVGGATGEIGGDAMGYMLKLMGWGDSGDDTTLTDINTKLGAIDGELIQIEGELGQLLVQMDIDTADIIANSEDPSGAISNIKTHQEALREEANTTKAGEGNRTHIVNIANALDGPSLLIRGDVDVIHDAIVPNTIVHHGVLNNYTTLLNTQYGIGLGSLTDAYNSLELYTSQLLYYQVQGVNLIVESKHILENNASILAYINHFQDQLSEEINDITTTYSFMYNTWRLLLSNVNLNRETWNNNFLSQEAHDIIHRAEFYRTQATGENKFGPRVIFVATENYSFSLMQDNMWLEKDGDLYELNCQRLADNFPGAEYPYWTNNSINFSSAYKLVTCMPEDGSESLDVGTYHIKKKWPHSMFQLLGDVEVEKYDENYTVKPDGNITYGLTTITYRDPYNKFDYDSSMWHFREGLDNVHVIGSANDWPIEIYNDSFVKADHFSGSTELSGRFTYVGTEDRSMTVDYDANMYLRVQTTRDTQLLAKASYTTAIWNHTEQRHECGPWTYNIQAAGDTELIIEKSMHINQSCTFTAKPGNEYYVNFVNTVDAADNQDYWYIKDAQRAAWSKLEKVNYIHIKFN